MNEDELGEEDMRQISLALLWSILLATALLGLVVALSSCQSITVTNYLLVQGNNGTRIQVSTDQAKPFDINRGLTATVPLAGM